MEKASIASGFWIPGYKGLNLAVQSASKQINLRDKVDFGKALEHRRATHSLSIVPKIL